MHNVPGEPVTVVPTEPDDFKAPGSPGRRRFGRRAVVIGAASLLLTACTEGDEARQFANDPRPTRLADTPTAVVTPPPLPPTRPVAEARPLADLLRPRGAPDRIFFRAGRELWTMAADGTGAARVFAPDAPSVVVDHSASPAGDRVAVLVQGPGGAEVVVLDAAGDASLRAGNLAAAFADPREAPRARSIDWSPQGGEAVVALDPAGLVVVPLAPGAAVRPILAESGVGTARWSPTGETVAYDAGPVGDGYRGLFAVAATDAIAATPAAMPGATPNPDAATPTPTLRIAPTAADRAVFGFAWLPDGRALVLAEGGAGGEEQASADLWRVSPTGGDRVLLASAGSVAPVARVGAVTPSPDGSAVAYTVSVPDGDAVRFHSLWVLELASARAHRLDVPAGTAVREVWWTGGGLLYRGNLENVDGTPTAGGFAVYRATGDGSPEVVFQAVEAATPTPGTPAPPATPAASPVP